MAMTDYEQSLTRAALRLYGDNERTRRAIELALAESALSLPAAGPNRDYTEEEIEAYEGAPWAREMMG